MRLIDADAIELRYSFGMLDPDGVVCIPMKDVRKSINETPTIDAVPVVHGQWIFSMTGSATCSECNDVFTYEIGNYCPNCGAKMDGDA